MTVLRAGLEAACPLRGVNSIKGMGHVGLAWLYLQHPEQCIHRKGARTVFVE